MSRLGGQSRQQQTRQVQYQKQTNLQDTLQSASALFLLHAHSKAHGSHYIRPWIPSFSICR